MPNERIAQFREHIDSDNSASTTAQDYAVEVLDVLDEIGELATELSKGHSREIDGIDYPRFEGVIDSALSSLRAELSAKSGDLSVRLLTWSQKYAAELRTFMRRFSVANPEWKRDTVTYLADSPVAEPFMMLDRRLHTLVPRIESELDNLALRDRAERLVEQTQRALEKATAASDKATDAAGLTGNASLSTHFAKYAGGERWAANTFRVLTVGAVAGGLTGVLATGPLDPGDWAGITYRIAIAAAAAGLAAYFGRQAGQHRRMYNWAKSMEVQLQSFPAFIDSVEDEDRSAIYRTFSRRVLSAPPEKTGESNEDSVGAAQLLDLITALTKRLP